MKNLLKLSFVFGVCFSQNVNSQVVIPHPIPCIDITPVTVDTFPSGITANDCIDVDGATVTFKTDQHYSIKAGEYIQFDNNTVITPDDSHLFHAFIEPEEMDLAWYYPNSTPGTVGQYEKLEIGAQFTDTVNDKIENFIDNRTGDKLNPFNPEDVDIYAEFWVKVGADWFGPKRVNGFFYQEFERNADTINWDTLATEHNFRIRFAPPITGLYRCKVSAKVVGHGSLTASEFTFNCVPSSNKGFMEVGENKRYFEFGEEPFFPIGHNIMSPQDSLKIADYLGHPVVAYGYTEYARRLRKLKESGGNYFRYIVSPWNTEIEFEALGNYSNRMTGAWEFDKMLDTTKALGLKMHYNMAVHFTFESPNGYRKSRADWAAAGDSLTSPITPWGEVGCHRDNDSGYCYRRELDMPEPRDFFIDDVALKFYKRRIRYMEARWGYSTEIAVTEILSEINHAGTYTHIEECTGIPDASNRPYVYDAAHFPIQIFEWHKKIADYMKDSLNSSHLISVNYGAQPDLLSGDLSYYLADVDINTFNDYTLNISSAKSTYHTITDKYHDSENNPWPFYYTNKPFLNCEYGTGAGTYECDGNAGFIRRLFLTGFTGLAGTALTWDSQWNEQNAWKYYQNINDLMQGIQLDNDNWRAMPPIVSNDLSVEMFHLRKGGTGEDSKIVGAVANRTYNYWTARIGDTLGCDSTNLPTLNYRTPKDRIYTDIAPILTTFYEMGKNKNYKVEWYNALTGLYLETNDVTSSSSKTLYVKFPDTLTGNAESPILFFKIYPASGTFLTPIESNEFETNLPLEFEKADELEPIELTNWKTLQDSINLAQPIVVIFPNPTTETINISISRNMNYENMNWIITNGVQELMLQGTASSSFFSIDISSFSKGLYYFSISSNEMDIKTRSIETIKIVKL